MAVVVTPSLSFGYFAGSEKGQGISPHFLRFRRGRQFGEQVLQAAGVVGGQQKGQIVATPDTPATPTALHPVSGECGNIASMLPSLAWWISPGA